ncbi:hypothetical protein GCM10027076_20990 [Nocardioides montaniterrae]
MRYWDGRNWGDQVAPNPGPAQPAQANVPPAVLTFGVLAIAAIGAFMALQPASLLSGTGTNWIGVALAVVATVTAWILRPVPMWAKVVCSIIVALALICGVALEVELEQKRQEIDQVFDGAN